MARDIRLDNGRFPIPGVYEKMLVGRCRCSFPCHSDPRLRLQELTAEQRALFEWFKAQCAWEAEMDRQARSAAGEPFVTDRRRFGGRAVPRSDDWPEWLRNPYSDVEKVRVYADDTVEPADD